MEGRQKTLQRLLCQQVSDLWRDYLSCTKTGAIARGVPTTVPTVRRFSLDVEPECFRRRLIREPALTWPQHASCDRSNTIRIFWAGMYLRSGVLERVFQSAREQGGIPRETGCRPNSRAACGALAPYCNRQTTAEPPACKLATDRSGFNCRQRRGGRHSGNRSCRPSPAMRAYTRRLGSVVGKSSVLACRLA